MSTKEKLIKSALALFVKRGIDNTSTALITKKAGFSEATLFVHFKSKQGLIDAVYIDVKNRQKEAFAAIAFTKDNARQSIINFYTAGVKYFITHFDETLFLNQVLTSDHVSASTMKKLEEKTQFFVDMFNAWKKQKDIKDITFDFYEKIIWSAMFDMTGYCRDKKIKKIPKHLENMMWDMLKVNNKKSKGNLNNEN